MLEPWVALSALLPTVRLVDLWASVGPWGATRHSACPVLRHSESGPLGLSVRECGVTGCASVRLPAWFVPHSSSLGPAMATRVLSAPAAGLYPSYRYGRMFIFYLLGVRIPCLSIFCQFWLCEEARSVSTYATILVLSSFIFDF